MVTISAAIIMVTVSFVIFIQSGAYSTVKFINKSNGIKTKDLEDYNTTSPIQADDLLKYGDTLNNKIKPLLYSEDFSQEQLSDSSLGI
ncbi:MAG: hypothetical protein MUF85_00780 [Patescibacteria group bacterium]|jgi:hypothetical protein|nr:hypothetical protein [Patescibacteria group bacterium]